MIKKFMAMKATHKLSIITALVALISQILKIWHVPLETQIESTLQAFVAFATVLLAGNTVNKSGK